MKRSRFTERGDHRRATASRWSQRHSPGRDFDSYRARQPTRARFTQLFDGAP
jgi:hypothetical protein